MKTMERMKMKIGGPLKGQINLHRSRLQKQKAEEEEVDEVKETHALVHNDKSAMLMQAFEVAKEEAAGTEAETMLGDMEITLSSISIQKDGDTPPPLLSSNPSPRSQFEYDVMNATHQHLDFDHLQKQKSYSYALMDEDEDKSISSEESLSSKNLEVDSLADADPKMEGEVPALVDDVLSPMTHFADYMFCRMESNLPDVVEDVNEFLSKDLHHLVFNCEGGGAISVMDAGDDVEDDEDVQETQVQKEELAKEQDEAVEVLAQWEKVLPENPTGSTVVEAIPLQEVRQARFEYASYNQVTGFLLRKEETPEPAEEEVLVRVDATSITTRDCVERLRRDNDGKKNMKMVEEFWSPGFQIVGHVMSVGKDVVGAENLIGKCVAALLPSGGGCSQYVCVRAEDMIFLPDAANSDEVVALLSSYMNAYQCLSSVVGIGIEPKVEVGEESESVGNQPVSVVGSEIDKDTESKKEVAVEPKEGPLYGMKVLIAGAGGVGLALIDLARMAGAIVHTLSDRASLNAIRDMGANHWYPLKNKESWRADWRADIDLVIDTIDDSYYYPSFYDVLTTRGRLVKLHSTSYPCTTSSEENSNDAKGASSMMNSFKERVMKDKTIDYNIFDSYEDDKELFEEDLASLRSLLRLGKIHPNIVSRVGFDELENEWKKMIVAGHGGVIPGVIVVHPWKKSNVDKS